MQTILGPRLSEVEVKFDILGWQAAAYGSDMGVMLNERQAMYVIGAIRRLSGLTFGVRDVGLRAINTEDGYTFVELPDGTWGDGELLFESLAAIDATGVAYRFLPRLTATM